MKTTTGMMLLAMATALLAGLAGAAVSAVSTEVSLDTRSLSEMVDVDEQDLDTRSFTVDWSGTQKLNTKKIVGTAILIR